MISTCSFPCRWNPISLLYLNIKIIRMYSKNNLNYSNSKKNNTVEPCSTSALLYEKFALQMAICKNSCLIQQVKIHSISNRRPSMSRGLKIQF